MSRVGHLRIVALLMQLLPWCCVDDAKMLQKRSVAGLDILN